MPEEQAFLDHLAKEPLDDVTRQVYADWLEERGDERGAYLRLEMELAALPKGDPRLAEMEQRGARMRQAIDPEWLRQAGKLFDVWLLGYPPMSKIAAIKVVREFTGLGLADAKHLVEALPARVASRCHRAEAEQVRAALQDNAAAQACIRPADAASPPAAAVWPASLPFPSGPFTVSLLSVDPAQRLLVIRALREATQRGLQECLHLTHGPFPVVVRQGVSREAALRIRDLFPDPGAVDIEQRG